MPIRLFDGPGGKLASRERILINHCNFALKPLTPQRFLHLLAIACAKNSENNDICVKLCKALRSYCVFRSIRP
jgi:hypothetical protein